MPRLQTRGMPANLEGVANSVHLGLRIWSSLSLGTREAPLRVLGSSAEWPSTRRGSPELRHEPCDALRLQAVAPCCVLQKWWRAEGSRCAGGGSCEVLDIEADSCLIACVHKG